MRNQPLFVGVATVPRVRNDRPEFVRTSIERPRWIQRLVPRLLSFQRHQRIYFQENDGDPTLLDGPKISKQKTSTASVQVAKSERLTFTRGRVRYLPYASKRSG